MELFLSLGLEFYERVHCVPFWIVLEDIQYTCF